MPCDRENCFWPNYPEVKEKVTRSPIKNDFSVTLDRVLLTPPQFLGSHQSSLLYSNNFDGLKSHQNKLIWEYYVVVPEVLHFDKNESKNKDFFTGLSFAAVEFLIGRHRR